MRKAKWIATLLWLVWIGIGLLIWRDFGQSADEPVETGMVRDNLSLITNHYLQGDWANAYDLIRVDLEFYGFWFNALTYPLQYIMRSGNLPEMDAAALQVKHIFVFGMLCLALAGIIKATCIATRRPIPAMLAAFSIAATLPYFYGHGFVNPKDIPFAALYTVTSIYMARSFAFSQHYATARHNQTFLRIHRRRVITTGLLIGLTAGIRFPGGMALGIAWVVLMVVAIVFILRQKRANFSRIISFYATSTVYAALVAALVIWAVFPASWPAPFQWAQDNLHLMAHHSWGACDWYNGHPLHGAGRAPFAYIPHWLYLKTPLHWLALGILGIVIMAWQGSGILAKSAYAPHGIWISLALGLQAFTLSTGATMAGSTMYNGIRQFLFIFPPFAFFASLALVQCFSYLRKKQPWLVATFCTFVALCTVNVVRDMVRLHPYEYIYFNELARHGEIEGTWNTDYWGLSGTEIGTWVKENIHETVPLYVPSFTSMAALETSVPPNVKVTHDEPTRPYLLGLIHGECSLYRVPEGCEAMYTVTRKLGGTTLPLSTLAYCR